MVKPGQVVALVIPIEAVDILDDWHVSGLAGSGSSSYTVTGIFVGFTGRTSREDYTSM